jgi:enoyl-[acyl-carrier protein] reductase II
VTSGAVPHGVGPRTPICERLGIDAPIFLAGMGGVAFAQVCAAVSEAGGFGTLGMAGVSPAGIREQMRAVRARTGRPFGVDLLAALPSSLHDAIAIIIDEGASAFIAGLGVPPAVVERCHRAKLLVMSMCGTVDHARRAADAGCDVVVAQGTEAGGHTGRVAGMALIPQIVDAVDLPVLAAGAIVDGRGLAAALALGAQGVWMGTRFIASTEARAGRAYKQRLLEAGSSDTVVTRCYSGKPMRVIANAYTADWERRPEQIQPFPQQAALSAIQPFPQQAALSARAGVFGSMVGDDPEALDRERSCMPAGQGIGSIDAVLPAAEIVARVMREARETLARLAALQGAPPPRDAGARAEGR